MQYYEFYIMGIILLPAIILSIVAEAKVKMAYKQNMEVLSQKGITAHEVAETILEKKGINEVAVTKVGGELTDYYSDKEKTVALSSDIYSSTSVAAIGIAMHEVGHAIQYHEGYKPVAFRNLMVKVCNLSNKILWPLVVIGLLFNLAVVGGGVFGEICLWSGIGFFGLAAIFNLVTLPVEFDASNRAKSIIQKESLLTKEEFDGASKVLNAAAWTYVAAMIVSIMNLVRFLLVVVLNSKKRD